MISIKRELVYIGILAFYPKCKYSQAVQWTTCLHLVVMIGISIAHFHLSVFYGSYRCRIIHFRYKQLIKQHTSLQKKVHANIKYKFKTLIQFTIISKT